MPGKIREKIIFFLLTLLILLLDNLSKRLVITHLSLGQSISVIPGIFHITLVTNTGTAFGLFKNLSVFFIFFSFAASLIIIYIFFTANNLSRINYFSLSLVLGGAIGNLIDRINIGNVIDFLDFRIWPVFNIADSAITIGVILLILQIIFENRKDKSKGNA